MKTKKIQAKKLNRNLIFILLLVITIFSLSFGKCIETKKQIYAPAVINENMSQMVLVVVETRDVSGLNRTGSAFSSLNPIVGSETQNSINTANIIARKIAKENGISTDDCDVLIQIAPEQKVEYIEGPSAGAALTITILSAFEDRKIKDDVTITGTIESDESVGSVGGLSLKAEAAYKNGFRTIIMPYLGNSEKIELLMLKNYYNITILQVNDVKSAFDIATGKITESENLNLAPEKIANYENSSISSEYESWIAAVTKRIINDDETILNDTAKEYRVNFDSRIANAKNAFETKNYYTAANIAFLLSIDEDVSLFSKEKMINEYKAAKECLNGFQKETKNSKNFQIIGPAETRYNWASVKLNDSVEENEIFDNLVTNKNSFIAPLLTKYRDIINAKYWCLAGRYMMEESKNLETKDTANQNLFNESKLKDYAISTISDLESKITEDNSDAQFRLRSAKLGIEKEQYVAALVDAAYIKSYVDLEEMNITFKDLADNKSVVNSRLNELLNKRYEYIWPQLFINHARIIAEEDKISGLRTALIAENLENYFKNAERIASEPQINEYILGENQNLNEKQNSDGNLTPSKELIEMAEKIYSYQLFSIVTFLLSVGFIAFVILFIIGKIKTKRVKPQRKWKR